MKHEKLVTGVEGLGVLSPVFVELAIWMLHKNDITCDIFFQSFYNNLKKNMLYNNRIYL